MSRILSMFFFLVALSISSASPIVLKGNSPSGDTVVAISSSDPNIEKYFRINFSGNTENPEELSFDSQNPSNIFQKTFSTALAGTNTSTGRNFGSFNPFFLPFFNFPLNLEGFGIPRPSQTLSSRMRGFESYEPMYSGNGEMNTVTAVNDNGHVYGNVKTISFDNANESKTKN